MTDTDRLDLDALDPEVRNLLLRLKRDDVAQIETAIVLARQIGTTARMLRWVIITFAAIIVFITTVGDGLAKLRALVLGH